MPDLSEILGLRLTNRTPWAENHLITCPTVLAGLIERFAPDPASIVDLGCGLGIKTVAMAHRFPGAQVTGVDVTRAFDRLDGILDTHLPGPRPDTLSYRRIVPGAPLPPELCPDVIYSWSVMEHIDRPILPGVISDLFRDLSPGGIVITQIAPLYYSPFGSHLKAFNDTPWAHLTLSDADLRASLPEDAPETSGPGAASWMFARYQELNRITAGELAGYFGAAGFDTLLDERRRTELIPPAILRHAHQEDALRTNELIFVHRKPVARKRWWRGRA